MCGGMPLRRYRYGERSEIDKKNIVRIPEAVV